ncbi:MAG TPA: phosphatidylglycerophosphatase A [Bryobacteraceae bacterium]|nr:phosphatidylglycerophosphatase A [Bryobacteraceae bacterium]
MNRLAVTIATWFGCGYFPWGPGTIGALAGLLIAMALHSYLGAGRLALLAAILVLLAPAIWASTNTARIVAKSDPGIVVVDEVLGQWTTLLGAAVFNWKALLAGFILFRVFDIWKPWPVRQFEKLPGGTGIVADDLAAGIYAALILYIGGRFGLY